MNSKYDERYFVEHEYIPHELFSGCKNMLLSQLQNRREEEIYYLYSAEYEGAGKVTGSYSRELDEAVNAVKTNEDRRLEYMTMMIHDMEVREAAFAEGEAKGALGMLVNLVKKGRMTPAEAAEEANMTVAEFEKQAALLPV